MQLGPEHVLDDEMIDEGTKGSITTGVLGADRRVGLPCHASKTAVPTKMLLAASNSLLSSALILGAKHI